MKAIPMKMPPEKQFIKERALGLFEIAGTSFGTTPKIQQAQISAVIPILNDLMFILWPCSSKATPSTSVIVVVIISIHVLFKS